MAEIARAAGLTQASAYAYFDNKESLFVAAVDADATELILAAHTTLTEHHVVDRFRAFLAALYLELDNHPLTRRVLDGGEPSVLPRLTGLPALRMTTGLIVSDLQAGQADGNVRQDVDVLALGDGIEAIILSLLIGAVQSGGIYQTPYQLGIDAVFDAMLRPPD